MEASTGNILLPQDWEDECGPPPEVYYVKAKVWPELEPDSLEQDEYRGSVQLVIDFVPPQVDSRTLTCWLLAGLDDDDPEWVATKVGLQEAKEDLRKASDLMEAIPGQRVPGAKTIAEEVAIKKKRMQVVATQKTDAERRVEVRVRLVPRQAPAAPALSAADAGAEVGVHAEAAGRPAEHALHTGEGGDAQTHPDVRVGADVQQRHPRRAAGVPGHAQVQLV